MGTVAVKVTASDGNGGSVSDTFNIVVSAAADTPPGLVTAQVDGETLTLTYNEPLDTGSEPAPGDFSVSVNGNTAVVSDVALSGSALTLELAVTVVNTDTVTVTYTAGSNPIQDLAGNDAADISFPGRAVDNVTVSPPGAPGSLTAIPGNGQVSLGWAPPSVTGGAAIVRYEYRVSPDGGNNWSPDWTAVPDGPDTGSDAADERAYLVTGLANGTAYTFEVRASNSTHSGPAARAEATPQTGTAADPGAPRGFAARAGDAAVDVKLAGAVRYRQPPAPALRGALCRGQYAILERVLAGRRDGSHVYRGRSDQRPAAHVRGAGGEYGGPGGRRGAGAGDAGGQCRRAGVAGQPQSRVGGAVRGHFPTVLT